MRIVKLQTRDTLLSFSDEVTTATTGKRCARTANNIQVPSDMEPAGPQRRFSQLTPETCSRNTEPPQDGYGLAELGPAPIRYY